MQRQVSRKTATREADGKFGKYLHHGAKLNGIFSSSVGDLNVGLSSPEGVVNGFVVGLSIGTPLAAGDIEPLPRVRAYLEL